MRLHHTGIISRDIKKDIEVYFALGYKILHEPVKDDFQSNELVFLKGLQGDVIELISPLGDKSSVKNSENGIHHLCYETDDFEKEISDIRKARIGTVFTDIMHAPALEGRRIVFVYLRTKHIIEILEAVYKGMGA